MPVDISLPMPSELEDMSRTHSEPLSMATNTTNFEELPLPTKKPKYTVAIVGAGASGLTTARQALQYDVLPVIFEASEHIGGLWRYKPEETEESSVMKSTVINTSKEMTAYSDFPPPPDFANFMHNRRMLEYLELYANAFHLREHIRFNHRVINVQRHPLEYPSKGRWVVSYEANEDGKCIDELFDGVLLCTGHHTKPYVPAKPWPGMVDLYKGVVSHAHSYKDHQGYDDKVIAVVGVGNSGVDIAVELSRVAKQVYLVSRRGTWVLHRNLDYSIPFDLAFNSRFYGWLAASVPTCLASWHMQRTVERRLNHEKYGLKPRHGVLAAHLTVNDELPNRLSCGTVVVKPNIAEFTTNGLKFVDGTEVERVDQVILSTGYSFEFPLVEEGLLIPVMENRVELYLNMFPPKCADWSTLAVIGLIQPLGSIMPISEMQARLYFHAFMERHLHRHHLLPSEKRMRREIRHRREEMARRYVASPRHTIQVDYINYMDELASMLGCRPAIWKYAFKDPQLAVRLWFGPNAPYAYRLEGPKRWEGARQALMSIQERVDAGMLAGNKRWEWPVDGRGEKDRASGKLDALRTKLKLPFSNVAMILLVLISLPLLYFIIIRVCNC